MDSAVKEDLKQFLDELVVRYNTPDFIESDPVSIPHSFSSPEDIEVAGFFSAIIAWGNRKSIVRNADALMKRMDREPFRFVKEASERELMPLADFVHRPFNGRACIYFVKALRAIFARYGSLGGYFQQSYAQCGDMRQVLAGFWHCFFALEHDKRVEKHLSNIERGAACKRLNMYVKWMVRKDNGGVDFGLWRRIPASALYLPLDIHTGNTGRMLGLLTRRQNDWRAVEEITGALREFDGADPVKYDYALFGAGIDKIIR